MGMSHWNRRASIIAMQVYDCERRKQVESALRFFWTFCLPLSSLVHTLRESKDGQTQ
jgi:hypothetical protein